MGQKSGDEGHGQKLEFYSQCYGKSVKEFYQWKNQWTYTFVYMSIALYNLIYVKENIL